MKIYCLLIIILIIIILYKNINKDKFINYTDYEKYPIAGERGWVWFLSNDSDNKVMISSWRSVSQVTPSDPISTDQTYKFQIRSSATENGAPLRSSNGLTSTFYRPGIAPNIPWDVYYMTVRSNSAYIKYIIKVAKRVKEQTLEHSGSCDLQVTIPMVHTGHWSQYPKPTVLTLLYEQKLNVQFENPLDETASSEHDEKFGYLSSDKHITIIPDNNPLKKYAAENYTLYTAILNIENQRIFIKRIEITEGSVVYHDFLTLQNKQNDATINKINLLHKTHKFFFLIMTDTNNIPYMYKCTAVPLSLQIIHPQTTRANTRDKGVNYWGHSLMPVSFQHDKPIIDYHISNMDDIRIVQSVTNNAAERAVFVPTPSELYQRPLQFPP